MVKEKEMETSLGNRVETCPVLVWTPVWASLETKVPKR
jgi:hypothetical protein